MSCIFEVSEKMQFIFTSFSVRIQSVSPMVFKEARFNGLQFMSYDMTCHKWIKERSLFDSKILGIR